MIVEICIIMNAGIGTNYSNQQLQIEATVILLTFFFVCVLFLRVHVLRMHICLCMCFRNKIVECMTTSVNALKHMHYIFIYLFYAANSYKG